MRFAIPILFLITPVIAAEPEKNWYKCYIDQEIFYSHEVDEHVVEIKAAAVCDYHHCEGFSCSLVTNPEELKKLEQK